MSSPTPLQYLKAIEVAFMASCPNDDKADWRVGFEAVRAVLASPAVESAPAADAGIVARVEGEVGMLGGAHLTRGTLEAINTAMDAAGVRVGDRVEVLVRVLDAEHAARRGGA